MSANRNHGNEEVMNKYDEYVLGKVRQYGDQFSDGALDKRFVAFYNSGARVRVRSRYGEEFTGTVGVTTGWRPTFLLMRRSSDHGSSIVLDDSYEVIAVKAVGARSYVMKGKFLP